MASHQTKLSKQQAVQCDRLSVPMPLRHIVCHCELDSLSQIHGSMLLGHNACPGNMNMSWSFKSHPKVTTTGADYSAHLNFWFCCLYSALMH